MCIKQKDDLEVNMT